MNRWLIHLVFKITEDYDEDAAWELARDMEETVHMEMQYHLDEGEVPAAELIGAFPEKEG